MLCRFSFSFGSAPAFLVHRIVFAGVFVDYTEVRWFDRFDVTSVRGVAAARFNGHA